MRRPALTYLFCLGLLAGGMPMLPGCGTRFFDELSAAFEDASDGAEDFGDALDELNDDLEDGDDLDDALDEFFDEITDD